jgi:hypothetical protein
VLRLRNSLLNTVLLYDEMLAARGARALDWVASTSNASGRRCSWAPGTPGAWAQGCRAGRRGVAHRGALARRGPIAWRDVAAVIPVPPGDSLRVRLSFVADNWRIDRVALAAGIRRPDRPIAAARLLDAAGTDDTTALASVRDADQRYLQTSPGQRFSAVFEAGTVAPGEARTFLLESQGYYIEWIRPGWIATGRDTTAFNHRTPLCHGAAAAGASPRTASSGACLHPDPDEVSPMRAISIVLVAWLGLAGCPRRAAPKTFPPALGAEGVPRSSSPQQPKAERRSPRRPGYGVDRPGRRQPLLHTGRGNQAGDVPPDD